jgi:hypothetical protein
MVVTFYQKITPIRNPVAHKYAASTPVEAKAFQQV